MYYFISSELSPWGVTRSFILNFFFRVKNGCSRTGSGRFPGLTRGGNSNLSKPHRPNTTDVFDSYGAKSRQNVLKTALTLEVYNYEGSRWFVPDPHS